jgi:hypothetical protein
MTLFPVVLSLCDRTGNWVRPYAEAGVSVVTVDMQEPAPEAMYKNRHHIVSDIRLLTLAQLAAFGVERGNVLTLVAAPPCTVLAYSGARWARTADEMALAFSLLSTCEAWAMRLRPKHWALENPAGRAQDVLGPPVAKFDPCDYGDPYTKQTWLWGDFVMPPRTPVEPTEGSKMHLVPPGPERQNLRSATPMGFARAFCAANR